MSKLSDCKERVATAIEQLKQAEDGYRLAKGLQTALETSTETPDLSGFGLTLRLPDGATIPLPIPTDKEALLIMLDDACTFLGNEITRVWADIYTQAGAARDHCLAAARQLAQQQQAGAVPPS
jgi:hypothetical protein